MTGLMGLGMLTACNNNDEPGMNGNNGQDGTALTQIALTVSSSASTRTVTGDTGDTEFGLDAEYTVNDLLVIFANEAGIVQQVISPNMKTPTNNTEDDKAIRVTEPFPVTPGDYYVYVLANYKAAGSALTPVVVNQTDMKQVFDIVDASKLSASGNFLMSNSSSPGKTTISSTGADDDELGDDGKASGGGNVQLIAIDIERVVGKVTFDQTTTDFDVEDAGATKLADVTLNSVGIINLNKKMFLVKGAEKATNKPISGDWAYPKDPNYDYQITDATTDATWLSENFSQPTVPGGGWASDFSDATFYCPENTMSADYQQNGQTTGVVYKATWVLTADAYTELDKTASDNYSTKFNAVLALGTSLDSRITDAIFKTADGTNFYTYNDLIFRNKNAACLYKAIAETASGAAADINTAFTTLANKDDATLEGDHIKKYEEGVCYYPVWIKHNPTTTVAMQQDKYGVVRNHWYDLKVTGITQLGNNKPTYNDAVDNDDEETVMIQVEAKIKKWVIVKQVIQL